jgi:hypothetical protein
MEDEMYDKNEANEGREGLASDRVLIWSGEHHAYWRPNSAGYTFDGLAAGLYAREEAERIIRGCDAEKRVSIREIDPAWPIVAALNRHRTASLEAERSRASADAVKAHHWRSLDDAPLDQMVLVDCERLEQVCEAIQYCKGKWVTFRASGPFACRPIAWMPKPARAALSPETFHAGA